jgi:excisionase family DNA binding protein
LSHKLKHQQQALEPLVVRIPTAAALLQTDRASIYRMLNEGRLPSIYLPGRRSRRIPMAAIRRLIDSVNVKSTQALKGEVDDG